MVRQNMTLFQLPYSCEACSTSHRKKFRVPDIGKYPRNRLIPPHIPNIGFVEQKQPWVFAAEFYDSMLVKRVSTGGN